MPDEALRRLERAGRPPTPPAAAARLLAARLRTGELARERVELAAWLGHAPARRVLGEAAPAGEHVPWERWAAALDAAGKAVVVTALLDRAKRRTGELDAEGLRAPALSQALRGVRAWCAAPSEGGLQELAAAVAGEERHALRLAVSLARGEHDTLPPSLSGFMKLALAVADVCVAPTGPRWATRLRDLCRDGRGQGEPFAAALAAWAAGAPLRREQGAAPESAAERQVLLHRLARGEVDVEGLRLAAYAGLAAAREALLALGEEPVASPARLGPWLLGLRAWGDDVAAQALLDLLWGVRPTEVDPHGFDRWRTASRRRQRPRQADLLARTRDLLATLQALEDDAGPRQVSAAAAPLVELLRDPRWREHKRMEALLQRWADVLRAADDLPRAARALRTFCRSDLEWEEERLAEVGQPPRAGTLAHLRGSVVERALAQPLAAEAGREGADGR